MIKYIFIILSPAIFLFFFPCSSFAIEVDFPYTQNFSNAEDYADFSWSNTDILTLSHESTGGYGDNNEHCQWNLQNCDSEDSAGLGGIYFPATSQVNIGFMIWFGSNYESVLDPESFKVLVIRDISGGGPRPIIVDKNYGSDYRTWGICINAGGDCRYDGGTNTGPSGSDSFKISEHLNEWIWMEFQAIKGDTNKLFITTQDGTLQGEYAVAPNTDTLDFGSIDILMGYWEGASNVTSESYFKIDLLKINNNYIGPPPGFIGNADIQPPSNVNIIK